MNSLVLKYILTIAEEKNMTRAAERLYISQPSLSQSVKNLEKELGVDLFERSQRGGVLTPAGEHYVEWAKQILVRRGDDEAENTGYIGEKCPADQIRYDAAANLLHPGFCGEPISKRVRQL